MTPENEELFRKLPADAVQALTVYGEARGERFAGQFAVAFVIRNRCDLWGQVPHQVCLAKNQFSCYLESDPNLPKLKSLAGAILRGPVNDEAYLKALSAVQGVQSGSCSSNVGRATFYRVIGVRNKWFDRTVAAGTLIKVTEVGHHEFFIEAKFLKEA